MLEPFVLMAVWVAVAGSGGADLDTCRRFELPHGHRGELVRRASTLSLDEINAFIGRFYDSDHFTTLKLGPDGS